MPLGAVFVKAEDLGAVVGLTSSAWAVVDLVGQAFGSRSGERLPSRLAMAVSDDAILCLLKQPVAAPLAPETVRVARIELVSRGTDS
jgi:hypothetical protein